MKDQKRMTAQRYAQLLGVAKAAVDTLNLIYEKYENHEKNDGSIKFDERELMLIIGHFCINSIEAFVNHLGYIFDDDWRAYEKTNFWDQYKQLIKILNHLEINITKINKEPFKNFSQYRESVRNQINHVHSSKHDYQEMDISKMNGIENLQKSIGMINAWVDLPKDKAIKLYKESDNFVKNLRD